MKRMCRQHPTRNAAGLTLLELAIALTVLGLLSAGAIAVYRSAQQQQPLLVTYDHIDKITTALSIYAETAGRIPCPSDPSLSDLRFGWERGVTLTDLQVAAARFPTGSCTAATSEGIVPFLSLNITDADARDGWGRYFTYAVSPQYTRTNDQSHVTNNAAPNAGATDIGTVHARCRTQGWAGRYDLRNISAVKARFCCNDQSSAAVNGNQPAYDVNSDLIIAHTAGGVLSPARSPVGSAPIANVGPVYDSLLNTTLLAAGALKTPTAVTSAQSKVLAPAFVLISHGQDGAGAYLANATANRYSPPAAGSLESINADFATGNATQKRTYVDGPFNYATGGAVYFDDIVRWMTQDSLMAAHGALSCQYP